MAVVEQISLAGTPSTVAGAVHATGSESLQISVPVGGTVSQDFAITAGATRGVGFNFRLNSIDNTDGVTRLTIVDLRGASFVGQLFLRKVSDTRASLHFRYQSGADNAVFSGAMAFVDVGQVCKLYYAVDLPGGNAGNFRLYVDGERAGTVDSVSTGYPASVNLVRFGVSFGVAGAGGQFDVDAVVIGDTVSPEVSDESVHVVGPREPIPAESTSDQLLSDAPDAAWTVSDSAVASVKQDGVVTRVGTAGGMVTVVATSGGASASHEVVFEPALAAGTTSGLTPEQADQLAALPSAADIAAAILANPANLLATDATGRIDVGSMPTNIIEAIAVATDARLLEAGDATDLIASIVARVDNTNVDEAALVAAVKASLFDAASLPNKLTVDATGRVTAANPGVDSAGAQAAAAAALVAHGAATTSNLTNLSGELQAVGNANWATATGFSTPTDVAAVPVLTAQALAIANSSAPAAGSILGQVVDTDAVASRVRDVLAVEAGAAPASGSVLGQVSGVGGSGNDNPVLQHDIDSSFIFDLPSRTSGITEAKRVVLASPAEQPRFAFNVERVTDSKPSLVSSIEVLGTDGQPATGLVVAQPSDTATVGVRDFLVMSRVEAASPGQYTLRVTYETLDGQRLTASGVMVVQEPPPLGPP